MKNKITAAIVTSAVFAPVFVFAQSLIEQRAYGLTQTAQRILGLLIPMAFALAVLYFFWGMAKYILNAGDDDARAAGKQVMINGIIALFVMVSIYGIINLLGNFIGITNTTSDAAPVINLPKVQ